MAPPERIPPTGIDVEPALGLPGDAAAETTGASVLTGGAWRITSYLLPQLYTMVISVVAARFLGPANMGRQSFIAFAGISVTMLFTGGLPIALMRFIGEERGRGRPEVVRSLVRWAWRLELAGAVVGAALMAAVALTRTNLREAWALAGIAAVIGVVQNVPASVLSGIQRWREASIVGFYVRAAATAATVGVLMAGGGVTGMFAVEAAAAAVGLLWTQRVARRALDEIAPVAAPAPETVRAARRYAAIASIEVILTFVIWRRSEFFFLERYSSAVQIALYSVSFATVNAVLRVPQALASVASPAFATLFGAGSMDRLASGFGRSLRLVVLLSMPIAAGLIGVGPALLRLVYGGDYRGTGPVLVVTSLGFPIIPACGIALALMAGVRRQRFPLICGVVATVVNLGLDFVLIPSHGALGAAVANLVAQLTAGVPVLAYASRTFGPVSWAPRRLAHGAMASAGAGLAGWACVHALGDRLGVPTGAVAGVVAFLVVATQFPVLSGDDSRWLEETVGARAHGLAGRLVGLIGEAA